MKFVPLETMCIGDLVGVSRRDCGYTLAFVGKSSTGGRPWEIAVHKVSRRTEFDWWWEDFDVNVLSFDESERKFIASHIISEIVRLGQGNQYRYDYSASVCTVNGTDLVIDLLGCNLLDLCLLADRVYSRIPSRK